MFLITYYKNSHIGGIKLENDKLFELMSKMYGEMQDGFKNVDKRFEDVDKRFEEIDNKLDRIESRVTIIEEDHGKKLDMLFDGYKQNSEKLNRIEKEVSKHEEIILKRIK